MFKNKKSFIASCILLVICMSLFFPFPNNKMLGARSVFMSFPIQNENGYVLMGIVGSILFVIAMILFARSLRKYHIRTILVVVIIYSLLPLPLIAVYQKTIASGIAAVSYDGKGTCNFESPIKGLLKGECDLSLYNHSSKRVIIELEFLDEYTESMESSVMNINGPFRIVLEPNHKKRVHLKELLDVSDLSEYIESGTSNEVHFKISDTQKTRIF